MKYSLILFDFDGTLADSRQLFINLYNELALREGYVLLNGQNLQELREMSIAARCRKMGIPLYRIPFIAAAIIKAYRNSIEQVSLYPGIREMLGELKEMQIPYAVLSSNAAENIEMFFRQQSIDVPEIYTSSRLFGKDRAIRKVLKAKNIPAEKVLYVGDELRDFEACQKAGVKMAWVHWGYDSHEALGTLLPDYEPVHPLDIPDLTH